MCKTYNIKSPFTAEMLSYLKDTINALNSHLPNPTDYSTHLSEVFLKMELVEDGEVIGVFLDELGEYNFYPVEEK